MNRINLTGLAVSAALFSTAALADEFDGSWVGAKIGSNSSAMTGLDSANATQYGLEGGHNWKVGGFVLGVDGFADTNDKAGHNPGSVSYGSNSYGIGTKLGLPAGKILTYAKLGVARTSSNGAATAVSGSDVHVGVGVEYKFSPSWSLLGEYTSSSATSGVNKLRNNNFSLGVNYYFGKVEKPAAQPEAAPAAATAPEAWKTLSENKAVCIEGAHFNFDSSKLRSGEIAKLNDVVSFAGAHPGTILEAGGHTCNIGSEAYNQKLSERRAEAVKSYLVQHGVPAERVNTVGYGEHKPVAPNTDRAGREQNRRVEVCTEIRVEHKVPADH